MSNSGINFKAYLVDGENSEVKRFFVDNHTVTSFVFMEEKLKTVFPGLRNCDFKINWKDSDGDLISISNDEDFITALTEMNYNPKVLYINTSTKNAPEAPPQFRVICDVCQTGISGYRYKCIECPDYDLCSTCESNGHHSEHMVLRLPNSNTSIAKLDRKMMYNAARALKKSAVQAHKCARDAFKASEKEKCHRSGEAAGTSTQTPYGGGCPFPAGDLSQILSQNISPFVDMLSKAAPPQAETNPGAPNSLSDLIHSVMEAFTGSAISDPTANESAKTPSNPGKTSEQQPSNNEKPAQNEPQQTPQPSAPNPNGNSQEMEWTIVDDKEDSASQTSTKTPPPQPPQDPRLMRGLAQLHEMGFSNENNFLNYMLEMHDYNVSNVVKAILELK